MAARSWRSTIGTGRPEPPARLPGQGILHCMTTIATSDPTVLQRAWKIEIEANNGDFAWYPDMESMRYCFYVKPDAPPVCTENQILQY